MSRLDLWNRAARKMREDEDKRWHAVADWLDSEAAVQQSMEPAAAIFNWAIEKSGGPTCYIRFARNAAGDPKMFCDTNEGATAVALTYLGETPEGATR